MYFIKSEAGGYTSFKTKESAHSFGGVKSKLWSKREVETKTWFLKRELTGTQLCS